MQRKVKMARVFRGKIAIPGDQLEAYFEALGQFENEKAPMRTQLEQCAGDFERALSQQYAPKTVRKHMAIITLFIDFVCWDTDVRRIEEITRGIANSAFRQWYLRKVGDRTESEIKTAIKKFFQFLAQEKGITNEAVLKSFQR
jgi:site-specific recombinase XerD